MTRRNRQKSIMIVPSMRTQPNAGEAPFRSGRRIFPMQANISPIAPPPPDPPLSRLPPASSRERLTIPPLRIATSRPAPPGAESAKERPTSYPSGATSSNASSHERWTRVTNNVRNTSSDVWRYDPVLGFTDAKKAFELPPAVDLERQRRLYERTKKEHFWLARQNHWQQLDAARWDKLCSAENKAAQLLAVKQARSKMCLSSVSYDLLTTGYSNGKRGELLKEKDAQELEKLQRRSDFLHKKFNTYNPIQGNYLVPLSDEDTLLMPRNSVRRCK